MNSKIKLLLIVGLVICSVFAGPDFFGSLNRESGDFLGQSIDEVEKKAEEMTVAFTDEERKALQHDVQMVEELLAGENVAQDLLNSDLQKQFLLHEKQWKRKEGARIVFKLLESVRIKAQLYVQNAYALKLLNKQKHQKEIESTQSKMDKLLQGIALSNNALAELLETE